MLAEMEEEIGVGDLIQESFDQQKQQVYMYMYVCVFRLLQDLAIH